MFPQIIGQIGKVAGNFIRDNGSRFADANRPQITADQNRQYSQRMTDWNAYNASQGTPAPSQPASRPAASGGGGYVDPYARYGGTAAYNSLRSGFTNQKNNIYGTARDAIGNSRLGLDTSFTRLKNMITDSQNDLNRRGVQADLAKRQGSSGIMDMVGKGIRSSGVMLANKNASNSSAAEALARVYGQMGHREMFGINNQYENEQSAIAEEQARLERDRDEQISSFQSQKAQMINQIVADTRDKLGQLDAQIANASLPDRINIEAEKENIRREAIAALQDYDGRLEGEVRGIRASSRDDRRAKAAEMATAGITAENPFEYTTQAPIGLAQTGPFASELPIFTARNRRQQRG